MRPILLQFLLSLIFLSTFVFSNSPHTFVTRSSKYKHAQVLKRQTGEKSVFAHFMVGIVAAYTQENWEADFVAAKAIGIDGFALNIGKDEYNERQLDFAYSAAQNMGFKLFLSFDFSIWNSDDEAAMAALLQRYGNNPAQFKFNGGVFVSSFIGDVSTNWDAIAAQAGLSLFTCPNYGPDSLGSVDCGFSWDAWASNNNLPVFENKTIESDLKYMGTGKPYMMPVSPWFFTHFGANSFNKNWVFYTDTLWNTRWDQVLQVQPQFVEIATWNDYGESHYIGPIHPELPSVYAPNGDESGAKKWVDNMPHDGWRDVAAPYIAAYKAGASAPKVAKDELVYYYRTSLRDAECNDPVPKPDGLELPADEVFVTVMATQPSTVIIKSGLNRVLRDVEAGIHTVSGPLGTGKQSFILRRGAKIVLSGSSTTLVTPECQNGAQPFNAFVGVVKARKAK